MYAASPTPTPARAATSWAKFRARPAAAVAKLQNAPALNSNRGRKPRSPRRPNKGDVATYETRNAFDRSPSWKSLDASSVLMRGSTAAKMYRST